MIHVDESTVVLGIETSCDETAAAVIANGRQIASNVVATQIDLHRRFGGVFPEVASRQHVLAIQPVIRQALAEARDLLDAPAMTVPPSVLDRAKSLAPGVERSVWRHLGSWIGVGPGGGKLQIALRWAAAAAGGAHPHGGARRPCRAVRGLRA